MTAQMFYFILLRGQLWSMESSHLVLSSYYAQQLCFHSFSEYGYEQLNVDLYLKKSNKHLLLVEVTLHPSQKYTVLPLNKKTH